MPARRPPCVWPRRSSAATLQDAEAEAVAAQHELAALMALPLGAPLPLPADRPHVGPYHTYFKEMFATRPAPGRARRIDSALPLRSKAIDAHALAMQAADEALAAASDARTAGRGSLAALLTVLDAVRQEQNAMLASVCRYNHDIADYALTVAAADAGSEVLAAMLVRTNRPAVQTPAGAEAGEVRQASATEPVPALAPPPQQKRPTFASPLEPLPPSAAPAPSSSPVPPAVLPVSPPHAAPRFLPPENDASGSMSLLRRSKTPPDAKDPPAAADALPPHTP